MKSKLIMSFIFLLAYEASSQGPPITGDNPIMLSSGMLSLRTLMEIRKTDEGTFVYTPLMVQYLPSPKTLIGIQVPVTSFNFKESAMNNGTHLGDILLLGKYQFLRNDQMGKTFRMVLKTVQTMPTGTDLGPNEISAGVYQGYYSIIAGYETVKYGISNELGYNIVPDGTMDEWRYKLGFGLPLLSPKYPVHQINLYFEYATLWRPVQDAYELNFAQGVQYAKGRLTLEAAIQLPLYQKNVVRFAQNSSVFVGTRYIF